jgi:NADH-quinone oxidoreductase subunit M
VVTLPFVLAVVAALVVWLPSVEPGPAADRVRRIACAVAAAAACVAPGPWAAGLVALATALHAPGSSTRTGTASLAIAASCHAATAVAGALGAAEVALVASLLGLALRGGAVPFHLGTAALCARSPGVAIELGGTSIAAVLVHLAWVVPAAPALAHDAAPAIVVVGATAAALSGVASLSRSTLRGLWSSSVSVHGGMLLGAVGAAGRGHFAGAVFVSVAFALALGGFGLLLAAIEARTGPVDLRFPGGRSVRFPRITWAFAFFAAAGIALPGTVGFAADDLLLHALWEESPVSCGLVLVASATLAVALLRGWSAAFLGAPARGWTAPDLSRREGAWVAVLAGVLVAFGIWPMGLLAPTLAFFE